MYCPACGAQNPEEARFCSKCGHRYPTAPSEPDRASASLPHDVQSSKTDPKRGTRNKSRWRLVFMSLLVGLVMVVAFLIILVALDTTASPVQVTTQFLTAVERHDWDTVLGLLHSEQLDTLKNSHLGSGNLPEAAQYRYGSSPWGNMISMLEWSVLGEAYRDGDEAAVGYSISYFGIDTPMAVLLKKEQGRWKIVDETFY